ncbi:transferase [Aureococcus anophagefferens]|nr:transferase [Aureococcus anophagefferens]
MALRILALAAAAAADWAAPKQYSVSVLLELPYIDLVEPIEVYYDEAQELQRMDYWRGADTSLAKFTKADGTKQIRGVEVDAFELVQPEFDPASGMIGASPFAFRSGDASPQATILYVRHGDGARRRRSSSRPVGEDDLRGARDRHGDGPTVADDHFLGTMPLDDLALLHADGGDGRNDAFRRYADKYGKTRGADRFSLFHRARRYVNAVNRKHLSYTLETNHLADWTAEEKQALRGRKHTPAGFSTKGAVPEAAGVGDLGEIDWRNEGAVTKVKDQGSCGSCWSYGTTGAIEGQHFLKHGALVELSQQNLMDCSWPQGNNACDGGLDSNAYDWMLEVNGGKVAAAEPYGGYKNADGACHAADGFHAKITGYVNVTGLPAFNDALANVGPLSISIDATPEDFYYYKSGFYYSDDCKGGVDDLDHTVLAVGVKVHGDQRYTIVKNSWSARGDGGYVYISQKNNCCGVATAATYPIIA